MNQNTQNNIDRAGGLDVREGITYLLIGGGIGATLALLFAPKPGSELRTNIADATRTGIDTTLEKAKGIQEQSAELIHTVRDKASAWYDFAAAKLSSGAKVAGDGEYSTDNEASNNEPFRNDPIQFTSDSGLQRSRTSGRKSSSIV